MNTETPDVRASRKRFAIELGPKVKALMQTIAAYLGARGSGMSKEDAVAGLEVELRSFFPVKLSRFAAPCDQCDGTGWELLACTHYRRCGRKRCGHAEPQWEHGYAVPCACPDGDKHRKRIVQVEDEIAAAGRVKKPAKGWRQVGQ